MIINIRCVTCGHVIADKWEYYKKEVAKLQKLADNNKTSEPIQTKKILDDLDLHKYCCRRMFLGHVDLIDEI